MRPFNSLLVEPSQIKGFPPTAPAVNPQPEVPVTSSIKPHSSTIRLDPLVPTTLRLDPVNTSTLRLEPHSSSVLRPDHLRTSLPSLEPSTLTSSSGLNSRSTSTPTLDPLSLHRDSSGSSGAHSEPQGGNRQIFSYPKPFIASDTATELERPRPSVTSPEMSSKVKGTPNHLNGSPVVVPLPDPPPNSCLKTGTLTNHRDSRSSSRVGLRVHFKLPEKEEDEQGDESSYSDEDFYLGSVSKEPPPVLAKPKL